jgi:hypothetical protein
MTEMWPIPGIQDSVVTDGNRCDPVIGVRLVRDKHLRQIDGVLLQIFGGGRKARPGTANQQYW